MIWGKLMCGEVEQIRSGSEKPLDIKSVGHKSRGSKTSKLSAHPPDQYASKSAWHVETLEPYSRRRPGPHSKSCSDQRGPCPQFDRLRAAERFIDRPARARQPTPLVAYPAKSCAWAVDVLLIRCANPSSWLGMLEGSLWTLT